MSQKTYYHVLDLEENASAEEIKQSFRLHLSAWRPDKFADADKPLAEAKLGLVAEAFEMLRNTELRKNYDDFLTLQRAKTQSQQASPMTNNAEIPQQPKESQGLTKEKAEDSEKNSRLKDWLDSTSKDTTSHNTFLSDFRKTIERLIVPTFDGIGNEVKSRGYHVQWGGMNLEARYRHRDPYAYFQIQHKISKIDYAINFTPEPSQGSIIVILKSGCHFESNGIISRRAYKVSQLTSDIIEDEVIKFLQNIK